MTLLERVIAIRTGGATERCHGIRHHGSYRVDSHTWGVLALLWLLWPKDFSRLAPTVMFHDVPEAWVGDIPNPTKRYNAAVKTAVGEMEAKIMKWLQLPWDEELPPEDRVKIRACDLLELYLWAREQIHGGNRHASCIVRELERQFIETPLPPEAEVLYVQLDNNSVVEHATDGIIMEINR